MSLSAWKTFKGRRTLTYAFGYGMINYGEATSPYRSDRYMTHGLRSTVDFTKYLAVEFAYNIGPMADNARNKGLTGSAALIETGVRAHYPVPLGSHVEVRPYASLRFGPIISEFSGDSYSKSSGSSGCGANAIACTSSTETWSSSWDRLHGLGLGIAVGLDFILGPIVLAPEYVVQAGFLGDATSLFHNFRIHGGVRY